ncbi:MAG: hypothetical protein VKI81_00260 [Synechococcaceae cyanobacterium]|nr:hypothetical protein [Synechococcaceae cyanobacterium]
MSGWFPALALPLLVAASPTVLAAEPGARPEAAEARAAAEHWLEGLGPRGLVLRETMSEGGFEATHAPSPVGPITRFRLTQPGWSLSLAFRGEQSPATPLRTLRSSFWYAALDRLPTPGLELPGWEVRPLTPTSTIRRGVEILSYGNGRIRLRVRTEFFALTGRDPSVRIPADAPAPAGSYFQIRRPFPLDLTLEAPVAFR